MTHRHMLQIVLTILFASASVSIWTEHGWEVGVWPILAAIWMNFYYIAEGRND